ncbi:hypothetical protein BaRGS_00011935 [Batillaria attramentaria]|uniref:LicD/FKTN/FKRP nucleotidyltransferase domain-containing protein n=1 Tax=Batillaria attramentaria TaxID=370345 RepID=A0ABD0LC48_9CAEN
MVAVCRYVTACLRCCRHLLFKCSKLMLVLVMIALCVFIFIPTRNLLLSPVLPGHWYDHSTVRLLKTYFGERHNFPLKNLASHKNSSDLKPQLLQVNVSDVAKFREAAYPEFYARREQLAARAKGDNEAARKLSLVDPFKPVLTVEERAQLLFTVDVFVRACRKHGLMFFLGEGTVLGAYRHHGLVPWDDDVDIYVNASQWREVHHVLSNIPGFSLQSTSTGLWKFYLSSLPRFFNKKFKWPNIDLFWFTEDNTHVWGFTKNFYEFLLIDRSHLLPLASVPWERWRMPVPACWHHYTEQRFDVSECKSTENSHKLDRAIPISKRATVPCSDLYPFFPFVFRQTDPTTGTVTESTRVGGRIIDNVTVTSPPDKCSRWHLLQ